MTTATLDPRAGTLGRLFAAELATARATPTAKLLLLAGTALSALACATTLAASDAAGGSFTDAASIRTAMHTSTVSTMILAMIAAIVAITGDFRHGRIDQVALSTPARAAVVVAKAAVSGAVGLAFGAAGAAASAATAWIWFRANGATLDFGESIVWLPLVGVVLAAPLFAVIGVGIGATTRHQSGTIGGVLAWILLVEPLAAAGIASVARWSPLAAALALTNSPDEALLSPASGGLVLAAFAGLALVIGAVQLQRTDI